MGLGPIRHRKLEHRWAIGRERSGERARRAARNYLISTGIAAERISIVSFGAERGVCTESTEECWSKNRRAIFRVGPR